MGPYGYLTHLAADSLSDYNVNNEGTLAYEMDTGIFRMYDGSNWNVYTPPGLALLTEQFIAQLLQITGDTRLFWMPKATDELTATDRSLNARTITWAQTAQGRLTRLGNGYSQSFSGSGQYGTVPDSDGLSFGNGSVDSAFSILVLGKITDSAAVRVLLSKQAASNNEYVLQVGSTDLLALAVFDQSAAAVAPTRTSSAAISQAAWNFLAAVYSAATGGATAANDMTIYENGAVKASSATNQASYVAMENLTGLLGIAGTPAGTNLLAGELALILMCQKALSASEVWAIKNLFNAYFHLAL